MIELTPILQKGFEAGAVKLFQIAVEQGFSSLSFGNAADSSKINFDSHLQQTYAKCSQTKTLINPDNPVPLIDLYVQSMFSSGKHTAEARILDDFSMIDEVWLQKRIVLTGSAGTGKSFFTKYLWLSVFERSMGKIPIYVELRNLNDLTTVSLAAYVFRTVVSNHTHPDAAEKFERALKDGRFFFIFDGFDEVKKEKREEIEKEIIALSNFNDENIVLVTSRPDEIFGSWQQFWCFHVEKLDKKQVVQLLEKVSFDSQVKKKFIQRVQADLFEKHESLLSTPLLATIMLLTYSSFADIPDKIHVFYEQAFETLFARHDALKDSFKRILLTKMPIDVFKNQFAAFCLITYDKETYSFSEASALEYIGQSMKMTGAKFESTDFLKDLLEAVCMLQRDGLNIVFSHRSFQEFFAARCLSRMDAKRVMKLLPKYIYRLSDSSGGMLYDMNKDLVEDCFLIPKFLELAAKLSEQSDPNGIEETCRLLDCSAKLSIYPAVDKKAIGHEEVILRFDEGEFGDFIRVVTGLLQISLPQENGNFKEFYAKDEIALDVAKKKNWLRFAFDARKAVHPDGFYRVEVFDNGWKLNKNDAEKLEKWFSICGYSWFRQVRAKRTFDLCNLMIENSKVRNDSIDTLLGLNT